MMHGREKSDSVIVAMKSPNKTGGPAAEAMERRAGAKENAIQQRTRRTQNRESVSQALERVREAARLRKKERFTALFHHITVDLLRLSFFALKRDAAPGADGVTWQDYEADLERKLGDLHARVHRGAYRPQPSRRRYIPKADGRQRPLAVAALEDKIVQRATAAVLNQIYEEDFLGFSYGFRPGRSQHDALDALMVGIRETKGVSWIIDADIQSFFDTVSHEWLIRFLEHRIGDRRIIRLIRKWLRAGVLEDGSVTVSETGTGQGSVISPLLANVYLHYVFDLWAARWRRREATGTMIITRYADDLVIGFERQADAHRFLEMMRKRFAEFALSLHPEKTRLIEFGRYAVHNRKQRGLGKPETFNFLGFTLICSRTRQGVFQLKRKTRRDRSRAKLRRSRRSCAGDDTIPYPNRGNGFGKWSGVSSPTTPCRQTCSALVAFRHRVIEIWWRTLKRRSQRDKTTWQRIRKIADAWLPKPKILHPWPSNGLPSNIQGGSRMRESRTYGSVRGALSNGRPYRDRQWRSRSGGRNRKTAMAPEAPLPERCRISLHCSSSLAATPEQRHSEQARAEQRQ